MKSAIFQILLPFCLLLFSASDSEALALKTEYFQHDAGAIGMTVAESLNFFRSDSSIRDVGHGMQKGFAESRKVLKKEAPPVIREVAKFAMGVGEAGTSMISGPAGIGEVGDSIQKKGVAETGKQIVTGMVDHVINHPIESSGQIIVGIASFKAGAKTPSGKSARTLAKESGKGSKGGSMTTVSRWGKTGALEPKDWVMNGQVSKSTFLRSFKWDPNPTNMRVPFKDWKKGENHVVPKADIKWPAGISKWKGIFGQRQYIPKK